VACLRINAKGLIHGGMLSPKPFITGTGTKMIVFLCYATGHNLFKQSVTGVFINPV